MKKKENDSELLRKRLEKFGEYLESIDRLVAAAKAMGYELDTSKEFLERIEKRKMEEGK